MPHKQFNNSVWVNSCLKFLTFKKSIQELMNDINYCTLFPTDQCRQMCYRTKCFFAMAATKILMQMLMNNVVSYNGDELNEYGL